MVPALSFTPQAAVAALLGSLLLRRNRGGACAAIAAAALTAVMLPRAIRQPQPRAHGPVLRVLTANLLVGRASEEAVASLVRRKDVDVLFVQELTSCAAARLKQAGLDHLLPHQLTDVRDDSAAGAGIYARFPLGSGLPLRATAVAQPTARLDLPAGRRVELVCVHPCAPSPPALRQSVARWRAELAALPPPADPPRPPRVIAGDFNATVDHAQFRRLLRRGYVDAACQTGNGLAPPGGLPAGPRSSRSTMSCSTPGAPCWRPRYISCRAAIIARSTPNSGCRPDDGASRWRWPRRTLPRPAQGGGSRDRAPS